MHCKRRKRGVEANTKAIEDLLLKYTVVRDTLRKPVFKPDMVDIYKEQKKHIRCIQDLDQVQPQVQGQEDGQVHHGKDDQVPEKKKDKQEPISLFIIT